LQRVIGLDVGSYSIKAVEIVNTFKSYEIANFYENVIPHVDELDPDVVIPACMEQLFTENNLEADRIITAMPGQYISSRIMPFNFSDVRKIETAIFSEVEDAVPFNMDDMVVDHQILGQMNNKTIALVAMTRKNFLATFLEHLQRIDIDPKLVDVDSLAFYNLTPFIDLPPGRCSAIVDVGHEKTSVCIVQDGVLRMFRSINLGGRYITEFLARDLETNFSEAQRVKHRVSRVICSGDEGSDLSEDDLIIAQRMTLAANAIVKELGRTFYAFKNWEKAPIKDMFVSGGTSRTTNFSTYLGEQLEMNVRQTQIMDSELKLNANLSSQMSIMPQAIAIGLRGTTSIKRHSQINLRQGEFAYVQNYESILKASGAVFKIVAMALTLLVISYGVKSFFYSGEISTLQKQYLKEYVTVFPTQKSKYKEGKYTFQKLRGDARVKLSTEISQKRNAIDDFITKNGPSPALVVLQGISEKLPPEIKINTSQYKYTSVNDGGGSIFFKGETDSYESVEKVVEILRSVATLKDIKDAKSSPKPGTDKKVIEFTIEASYASK
jgi:type IV pilus assembly protein PilM